MSHGEELSRVHSPSAVWVHSVSTRGFEVCSRETNSVHFLKPGFSGLPKAGVPNFTMAENHSISKCCFIKNLKTLSIKIACAGLIY